MQTRSLRFILIAIFTLAVIAGVAYLLYANADKYVRLLRLSLTGVLALLALSLASPVLNGLLNTYLFRGLGANVTNREGFLLASAATLANQLPLPAGIMTRGIYLKHKHSISYTKYLSAQLALFVCTVAADGLVGLGVLLDWRFFESVRVSPVLIAAFAAMAACLLVFWLPLGRLRMPAAIQKWTNQAVEGWLIFSTNPSLLLRLLGLQMGMMLLLAIRYWLAFHMLSQAVTAGQALLFSSASVLTQLVSFAPGGLGVREAIVGAVATALGFELAVSLAAVELDRLVATFTIVIVGWISTVLLGRDISEAPTKSGPPFA